MWQRRQDSAGVEEVTLEDSSTTLCETGMPVEPTNTYLLIRKKNDGTVVQRIAKQVRPWEGSSDTDFGSKARRQKEKRTE